MKTLDPTFQNQIAQPTSTITWCWLIERIDGVKLGFTSFDLSLTIDGVTYEPATGFAPSADSSDEGFKQSDSQSLNGILSSEQISDQDLIAGVYQYAKITCFQVDVTNLPATLARLPPNFLEVYKGFLGKVTQSDRGFTIEVRKIDNLLETEIGKTTSKKCGHELGDENCQANIAAFTTVTTVNSVINQYTLVLGGTFADGQFNRGKIEFTTGANQGIVRDISSNTGSTFVMFQPFPSAINPGESVKISEGCDKTLYTCFVKFNNVINGDHEPHIPTQDQANNNPGS
ncbi:MAG: DUF2163 domain-containing protein [Cyanobacteria bacterium P01_F01_bin.143]